MDAPYQQRFRFHNLASLEVHTSSRWLAEHFAQEYAYHQAPNAEGQLSPWLRLTWMPPSQVPQKWVRESQSYRHKGLARWRYTLMFTPQDPGLHIWAWGNRWAGVMVQHMLVHHGLHWLLGWRGILLLHAGAVVYQGRSWLLTAPGGVGKTALTAQILQTFGPKRVQLHSDDFVFIYEQNDQTYSAAYITRAHLYVHHLHVLPNLASRLSRYERLKLHLYGLIRKWSRGYLRWAVRVPLSRLWPEYQVAPRAPVAGWIWLHPGPRCLGPQPWSMAEAQDALLEMQFHEARYFLRLVEKNRPENWPSNWTTQWRAREARLLNRSLGSIPGYRLQVPRGEQGRICSHALAHFLAEQKEF